MTRFIIFTGLISIIVIAFYFLVSPYQNCKRDYVNDWIEKEEARDKYISNLDREKREQFCIANSAW